MRDIHNNVRLSALRNSGALLGTIVLVVLLWYQPRVFLAGIIYLLAVDFLFLMSLPLTLRLRKKQRVNAFDDGDWLDYTKGFLLIQTASELAILGILSIWSATYSGSREEVIRGYLLFSIFVIILYKMVAITDRSNQEEGSKPISYFGRPRSRSLLFCGLIGWPIIPIIIVAVSCSGLPHCPALLQPPRVWFLLIMLSCLFSFGFVYQRYRSTSRQRLFARVFPATILILALTAIIQFLLTYDLYIYVLSSISLIFLAATISLYPATYRAPQQSTQTASGSAKITGF